MAEEVKKITKKEFIALYIDNEQRDKSERLTNDQLADKMGLQRRTFYYRKKKYEDDIASAYKVPKAELRFHTINFLIRKMKADKASAQELEIAAKMCGDIVEPGDVPHGGTALNAETIYINQLTDEEIKDRLNKRLQETRAKNQSKPA